ncbi:MAG TPA: hypothetical protein DDX57_04225 [Bacteroidales bacterium]|nr:hypothetical protein [Bacteroidales bacterium]
MLVENYCVFITLLMDAELKLIHKIFLYHDMSFFPDGSMSSLLSDGGISGKTLMSTIQRREIALQCTQVGLTLKCHTGAATFRRSENFNLVLGARLPLATFYVDA